MTQAGNLETVSPDAYLDPTACTQRAFDAMKRLRVRRPGAGFPVSVVPATHLLKMVDRGVYCAAPPPNYALVAKAAASGRPLRALVATGSQDADAEDHAQDAYLDCLQRADAIQHVTFVTIRAKRKRQDYRRKRARREQKHRLIRRALRADGRGVERGWLDKIELLRRVDVTDTGFIMADEPTKFGCGLLEILSAGGGSEQIQRDMTERLGLSETQFYELYALGVELVDRMG